MKCPDSHPSVADHESQLFLPSLKGLFSFNVSVRTQYQATICPAAKRHLMAFCWWADGGPLLDFYWGCSTMNGCDKGSVI